MPLKRILIADDHSMTRTGISLLLKSAFPQVDIVEANNGHEAITQYKMYKPDIVLMDYNMPVMNGLQASDTLLMSDRSIRIILVTMFDTMAVALNFIKIGGRGFISKSKSNEQIPEGIRVVSNGEIYCSSENEDLILKFLEEGIPKKIPKVKFTTLELSIIVKLLKGKTSKETGEELEISTRTVETYRYDLIKKIGVKNSVELSEYIYKNGIVG